MRPSARFTRYAQVLGLVAAALSGILDASSRCDAAEDVESLVDQLAARETLVCLGGYFHYGSSLEFLPFDADPERQVQPKAHDRPVLALLRLGVDAVPALLAHLDDDRPTRVEPHWANGFSEVLDWNRRSKMDVPAWGEKPLCTVEAQSKGVANYRPTVGDLCYEVLGQIVNRDYYCSRQFGCFRSGTTSPGQSSLVRTHLKKTWGGLTPERHRALLTSDFREADSADRRLGAYFRLAFYYPDVVEALVVEELRRPHYSEDVVIAFCRDTLLAEPDPLQRRQLLRDFVLSHDEAYEQGLQRTLQQFGGGMLRIAFLYSTDALAARNASIVARDVLLDVYNITITDDEDWDEPDPAIYATSAERQDLIQSLTYDRSPLVGDVVQGILARDPDNVELVSACLLCLANRRCPEVLTRHLERVDSMSTTTVPLHVAVVEACTTSREKTVRDWLRHFALTTTNGDYFVATLDAVENAECVLILKRAEILLSALAADSPDEQRILSTVTSRFPNESLPLTADYLKDGDPSRIVSVCNDLSSSTDPRILLLERFFSDRRETQQSLTVRDFVARAIAGTIDGMEYEPGTPEEVRAAVIEELKQHCDRLRKGNLKVHAPAVAD
jgi:hypothetical protein